MKRTADLVPEQECLSLQYDALSASFWLVNSLTFERLQLPPVESAELLFDEECGDHGIVASYADGAEEPECKPAGEMLAFTAYRDQAQRIFVMNGERPDAIQALDDTMREFKLLQVTCTWGPQQVKTTFAVAAFAREHHYGLFLRWNLHSLFTALLLTSHGGHRWVWVAKNWEQWTKFGESLWPGHSDVFLKAQQVNKSLEVSGEDPARCLLWPSCSTAALLALLARLSSSSSPQAGALSSEKDRETAKCLLTGLLDLLKGSPFDLRLLLDSKAVFEFPNTPRGCNVVSVPIDSNMCMCIDDMAAESDRPDDPCYQCFAKMGIEAGERVHIVEVLARCVRWRPRPSGRQFKMLGQLCLQLAQRLDAMVLNPKGVSPQTVVVEPYKFDPHTCNAVEMSSQLARYWRAQQKLVQSSRQYLSVASDKSRVLGLSLLSTAIVSDGGEGIWVTRDFVGEITVALATAEGPEQISTAWKEQRQRQREFLLRAQAKDKSKAYRPGKRFRIASCRNLQYLDHQLQLCGIEGLKEYQIDTETEHWSTWPLLTVAWDQEASNVTSAHYCWYHAKLNMDIQWDYSHGSWNDIKQSCRDVDYTTWLFAMLLTWNIPHGPWGTDARMSQMTEMLQELFSKPWNSIEPVFGASVAEMLQDADRSQLAGDPLVMTHLWNEYRVAHPFVKKGTKSNMNRFMSLVRQGRREARFWTMRRVSYLFVCMENDDLKHKGLEEVLKIKPASGSDDRDRDTNSKRMNPVDQALRKSGANALVLALHVLSAEENRRRLCIFVECSTPVEKWHSHQNKTLRSTEGSLKWAISETHGGGLMRHLNTVWSAITLAPSLHRQRFWLPHADSAAPTDEDVFVDNGFAAEAASLCMALLHRRLIRTLPISHGWPFSSVRMLASPEAAEAEIQRFRRDIKNFRDLCEKQDEAVGIKALCDRHLLQRVCNKQLEKAFDESSDKLTEPIESHLRRHFSRLCSTQIVEDSFNCMKNDKVMQRRKQLSGPERAAGILMSRGIMKNIHKYREAEPEAASVVRGATIPKSFFQMDPAKNSLPLKQLISTSPHVKWWSPNAERSMAPIADLELINTALAEQKTEQLRCSWLGCLAHWRHSIVIRRAGTSDWSFALGPVADSCVLVWPARERKLTSGNDQHSFFEPRVDFDRPSMVAVYDLGSWEACSYEWKSPAAIVKDHPLAITKTRIVALRTSEPMALLRMAGLQAFWALPVATLQALAGHLSVHCAVAGDSFALLYALLEHCLDDLSPDELLDIASKRLALLKRKPAASASEVLDVPDAADFLSKEDAKGLKKEESKSREREEEFNDFRSQYHRKKAEVKESTNPRGPAHKKRKVQPPPRKVLPQGDIPQAVAREFCPPGASIWRALRESQWCGRIAPFSYHSRSWRKYGERKACVQVLQCLWSDHCDRTGTPQSEIPIDGLFEALGAVAEGGNASSSVQAASSSSGRPPRAGRSK